MEPSATSVLLRNPTPTGVRSHQLKQRIEPYCRKSNSCQCESQHSQLWFALPHGTHNTMGTAEVGIVCKEFWREIQIIKISRHQIRTPHPRKHLYPKKLGLLALFLDFSYSNPFCYCSWNLRILAGNSSFKNFSSSYSDSPPSNAPIPQIWDP